MDIVASDPVRRPTSAWQAPAPLALLETIDLPDELLTCVEKEAEWSWYGRFDVSGLADASSAFIAANSDAEAAGTGAGGGAIPGDNQSKGADGDWNPDRGPATKTPLRLVMSRLLEMAEADCAAGAHPAARDAGVTRACWLTVRMFKPTNAFASPRWHRDGCMFPCSCTEMAARAETGREWKTPERHHAKYAITLLGPETRVLRQPNALVDEVEREIEEARRRGELEDRAEERTLMAARLAGQEELRVERGRVIRFSWGQVDSPVHSEPDWSGMDRVFVSVLFGTEEEIRDMAEHRRRKYGVDPVE